MKYKVGDKVRVRQWDDMVKEFGINKYGDINIGNILFSKAMKQYCREVFTINYISDDRYYVKEAPMYGWTDDMFESVDILQAITDKDREIEELTEHIQKVFDVIQEKFNTPPSAETIANHLHLHNYRKTTLVEKDCSDWLHDHCCYDEQYELADLFDESFGVERDE